MESSKWNKYVLKGDRDGLNGDGKGDLEMLQSNGKAFKDARKEQEQEHCIQSKMAP